MIDTTGCSTGSQGETHAGTSELENWVASSKVELLALHTTVAMLSSQVHVMKLEAETLLNELHKYNAIPKGHI